VQELQTGPLHRFQDWPNERVPKRAAGVYTVWEGDRLLYVGMSGRAMTAEDRELEVGVRSRPAPQEQVQRPPASDPPPTREARHRRGRAPLGILERGRAVGGDAAGLLVGVEPSVRPRPVRRGLEDRASSTGPYTCGKASPSPSERS
jgi:hypothetical protein